jgi:hypothetical protein
MQEAVIRSLCLNAEAARLAHVAGETIRYWRRTGRLQAWRVGSVWLYDRAEVLRVARARDEQRYDGGILTDVDTSEQVLTCEVSPEQQRPRRVQGVRALIDGGAGDQSNPTRRPTFEQDGD